MNRPKSMFIIRLQHDAPVLNPSQCPQSSKTHHRTALRPSCTSLARCSLETPLPDRTQSLDPLCVCGCARTARPSGPSCGSALHRSVYSGPRRWGRTPVGRRDSGPSWGPADDRGGWDEVSPAEPKTQTPDRRCDGHDASSSLLLGCSLEGR